MLSPKEVDDQLNFESAGCCLTLNPIVFWSTSKEHEGFVATLFNDWTSPSQLPRPSQFKVLLLMKKSFVSYTSTIWLNLQSKKHSAMPWYFQIPSTTQLLASWLCIFSLLTIPISAFRLPWCYPPELQWSTLLPLNLDLPSLGLCLDLSLKEFTYCLSFPTVTWAPSVRKAIGLLPPPMSSSQNSKCLPCSNVWTNFPVWTTALLIFSELAFLLYPLSLTPKTTSWRMIAPVSRDLYLNL